MTSLSRNDYYKTRRMKFFSLLTLGAVLGAFASAEREFRIDYEHDQFLLDGEPFRYVSGSLHYFRVPSVYWRDRLRKLRSAGLNAVSTYVEWRTHEKTPGTFDFSGDANVIRFIEIAAEEGLLVLLRPGPYICAEREMGGLPHWLLTENPNMQLRTNDATFMSYVHRWFTVLMTRITPLLYGNGGPIIMVQVENEYGSYFACDKTYLNTLKEILVSYVGNSAVLYTTDGNGEGYLKCGKISGVYATVDFGASADVNASFRAMRSYEPRGPLINSEFYTGWLDHWGDTHANVPTSKVVQTLETILNMNASVNFYMFFGGTNFGFTAGADILDTTYTDYYKNSILNTINGANLGSTLYSPQLTSYDYDAPLTEAGDPTEKYYALRNTVIKYLPPPSGSIPQPVPKGDYGNVEMKIIGSLFDLAEGQEPVKSMYPLTFEDLGMWSGFVLYQTRVFKCFSDPAVLSTSNLHDRAQVFVNKVLAGTLSRMRRIESLPILAVPGDEVALLVENQGRVNYGSGLNDFKGLLRNVTVNDETLEYWTMYKFPLENHGREIRLIDAMVENGRFEREFVRRSPQPYVYFGDFILPRNITVFPPPDTFLDLAGWFKGVVFINGFNLGRYWSVAGPQRTLYLPGSLLKLAPASNRLVVIEFERTPAACRQNSPLCLVRTRTDPILDTRGCSVSGPNRLTRL